MYEQLPRISYGVIMYVSDRFIDSQAVSCIKHCSESHQGEYIYIVHACFIGGPISTGTLV